MKILVCISNVPDTTTKIAFTDNNTRFNTTGVQYIINPYDDLALSKALDLTAAGGEVTVITVGNAGAEVTLRKALAIGAHKAVRVDAEPVDAWFTARQIANYAADNNFDAILAGRESIDYNGAQVPAMVAEMLGLPCVSIAKKIDVNGSTCLIDSEIEGGKEVVELTLPFVAGCAEGVAEAKIPNMRGIMAARTKPLEVVAGTSENARAHIAAYENMPARQSVKLVAADNLDALINYLNQEAKVI